MESFFFFLLVIRWGLCARELLMNILPKVVVNGFFFVSFLTFFLGLS